MTIVRLSAHRQAVAARHAARDRRRWSTKASRATCAIAAYHDNTPGFERDFVSRTLDFYSDELYLRGKDGKLAKIDVPDSVDQVGAPRMAAAAAARSVDGRRQDLCGGCAAGDAASTTSWPASARSTCCSSRPSATSLESFTWTRHHLVLNVLDDVKNRLVGADARRADGWTRERFVGAPTFGTLGVRAVDADDSDAVWLTATDYLTPSTLALGTTVGDGSREVLKTMPTFFDASKDVDRAALRHLEGRHEGAVLPGAPKDLALDGTRADAAVRLRRLRGLADAGVLGHRRHGGWLEQGGVYVVANIRGGGEYGPRWHQAALKQNRHKAYEDFAAVAQDLVARKVTSREHLGIMGGSNGGLLVGNMLTQYPELFGAVVVQVPLLDMKRYSHLLAGRVVDGRVRRSGHRGLGLHPDVLAVPAVRRRARTIRRRSSSDHRPATTACIPATPARWRRRCSRSSVVVQMKVGG